MHVPVSQRGKFLMIVELTALPIELVLSPSARKLLLMQESKTDNYGIHRLALKQAIASFVTMRWAAKS
jgi:hypothetical protein